MERTLRYIVLCLAAALAAGCEKQIDIDIEDRTPEVVVRSLGQTDSPLQVRLTYSRPTFSTYYVPYGGNRFEEITGATVALSCNGAAPITATENDHGNYKFPYSPQPGDRLSLTVSVAGRQPLSAVAEVPGRPVVADVRLEEQSDNADERRLTFSLLDDASSAVYYAVRVRCHQTIYYAEHLAENYDSITARDTVVRDYYVDFSCTDYTLVAGGGLEDMDPEDPEAASTYWGDELLFSDANISGLAHSITLTLQRYNYGYDYSYDDPHIGDGSHYWTQTDSCQYHLEVSALSRDAFLYLNTVDAYDDDALLSLFREPIQIHGNISGGIGIFAVRSLTTVSLDHEPLTADR